MGGFCFGRGRLLKLAGLEYNRNMKSTPEKISNLLILVIALLFTAYPATGAQFVKPSTSGNTIVSGEGLRNVYAAGGNVTVTSDVSGDLLAAGGNVIIQGNIEQDLMAAGGTVVVTKTVGGNLTLARTAEISGDLVVGGGNVVIESPVAGMARVGGGTVTINSRVGGEVFVAADQHLTFGRESVIPGKITYKGKKEAVVQTGAQISSIDFQKISREHGKAPFAIGGKIIWTIGLVIAGLLLLRFFPRRVSLAIDKALDRPWLNLGIGLALVIVLPVTAVLLLATVIGFYAALIIFSWLVVVYLVMNVIASIFLGVLILKWLKKYSTLRWTALVTGAVLLMLLKFIPVIGFLAGAILWLIVFGAALRLVKEHIITEEINEQ